MNRSLQAVFVTALALAAAAPGRTARAEDEPAQVERERRIEETIARLRNPSPIFAGDVERIRALVLELMNTRTARADEVLRQILLDTGAHANVVEQIATATLYDPQHRFLPDLVERLRVDAGGDLEHALERLWPRADAATVRMLAGIALEPARGVGTRRTAVRLLGLTGDGSSLEALVALWSGPDPELREAARAAFEAVLPLGVESAAEAVTVLDAIRRDDLPFHEVLRRALRARTKSAAVTRTPPSAGRTSSSYLRLAEDLLPAATLEQILRLYLMDASAPEIRSLGAKRLAAFPYESVRDPDARLRAARGLFAMLRGERDPAVEMDVLRALVVLAPAARGSVAEEDMTALLGRMESRGRDPSAAERRMLITKLLGELRDKRSVVPLESAFDALDGGDSEARLAILEALQGVPEDFEPWLVRELAREKDVRVVRKLAALLARSRGPAAVEAFRHLLAEHKDPSVRLDAAKALGTLWAGSSSVAARDALLGPGLSDDDPAVRRTCASALGFPGPGEDAVRPRLREAIRADPDESVRLAAAKALLDLDESRAAEHFPALVADRPEVWGVWRDHLLDGLGRRDTTPDRLLAAADALAAARQGARALELLRGAAELREGVRADAPARDRVRERLVVHLLEQGTPGEAETWTRRMLESSPRPEDAQRWEVLLARALVNSGERPRWAEAESRLLALRSQEKLPAGVAAEASVVLGDLRLRLDDPTGALAALEGDFSAAPDALRLLRDQLVERAKARAAEDRKQTFVLLESIDGPAADGAAQNLRLLGPRAVPALREALARAEERAQVVRLLRAAAAVTGATAATLPETATREQIADAVRRADESLAAAQRSLPVTKPQR